MKKNIYLALGFLVLALLATLGGAVAAFPAGPVGTLVTGVVYEDDHLTPIDGALVEVQCDGVQKNATSLSDGSYVIDYTGTACGLGDTAYVTATKGSASGSSFGTVQSWTVIDVAVVNVSVPEFGLMTATLTIAGVGAGLLFIRRH